MRLISTITREELIELVGIVLPSDFKVNPEDWKVLDYGDEPGTAFRYDAEEYELRITWEEESPICVFIVAQGHFEALEADQLNNIQQKLQEMGFNILALGTWDSPVTEWDFDITPNLIR
ncbi:hypothetical protein [Adhaeribacter radiodurans]|uniref:Uncharacterized protein n=1 Tax=Adhaeribacter radiodurans TaxID=2745197 RepID=A0A7L7LBN2_9BACT|nr:hypothetical protein [Adhaeribacter radiodurans]QMU30147.1 hypothetical protein HUW48_19875 [Adhaeribacter radiodurans]